MSMKKPWSYWSYRDLKSQLFEKKSEKSTLKTEKANPIDIL